MVLTSYVVGDWEFRKDFYTYYATREIAFGNVRVSPEVRNVVNAIDQTWWVSDTICFFLESDRFTSIGV